MAIGIPAANAILTSALAGTVYVSLHNDDPGGTGASSVGDRLPAVFTVANGQASNAAAITFAPPPGTYTHAGLWVDEQWWGACAFEEPVVVGEDRVLEIPAGALRVGREQQPGDLFSLPPERDGFWEPGLMAVGGIPKDDDPVRPAQVYLPPGDPYGGYSVDPALGAGSSDATSAIQSALNAAGAVASENSRRVVLLAPGTYIIGGEGLTIPSYVTLRGTLDPEDDTVWPTRLSRQTTLGDFPVAIMGHRWIQRGISPVDVVADVPHGSFTATVASDPGYEVGELVVISQLVDEDTIGSHFNPLPSRQPEGAESRGWFCLYDRPTGQVLEISEITANGDGTTTLTFSAPIRLDYLVSLDAEISRLEHRPQRQWSGIEDIAVEYGGGGDGGGNIHIYGAKYCWVKNVESARSEGHSINVDISFRCEVRDCYAHETRSGSPSPGGAAYGLGINVYAADNLFENCISWNFNKVMIVRAGGGGNVFGYCYMEDGYGSGYPTIPEVGLNSAHFATPHHDLIEGCQSWNISGDTVWGNSIHLTFARNHVTGRRRNVVGTLSDSTNRRFVEVPEWQLWSSYIGNVLGYEDMPASPQSGYVYEDFEPWSGDPVPIWQVGRQHNEGLTGTDTRVVATCIRHGNFDWVREQQDSHEGDTRAVPNSFYLTSKPAFFGANPWPWVDPTTGQVHTLPARERFNRIHGLED